MKPNVRTRQVMVGNVAMGGGCPVVVQSMLNEAADDVEGNLRQIEALAEVGCEVVRMAIPRRNCLDAFEAVCARSPLPVVADIHFDPLIAIEAARRGAAKLRINPGNIGGLEATVPVLDAAREASIPIRIGVNAGSLDEKLSARDDLSLPEKLSESAAQYARFCAEAGFSDLVVSAKAHDVMTTVATYRILSEKLPDMPLHIGVTEAGTQFQGIIKSASGLGILLEEGIGDTLRISLTDDPVNEVRACWTLLAALDLRRRGPEMISCPTCGRCQVNLIELAQLVEKRLATVKAPVKVAVMGCVVNGPGEARDADIGVACGQGSGAVFVKGEVVRKVDEADIVDALMEELESLDVPSRAVRYSERMGNRKMTKPIMRLSKWYAPTLKEDPSDAELASHRLLLRAGMMRKQASGLYAFLPLGMRVLNKVEAIVNEEMDNIGAQQILMPFVQPSELWHESGRWDDYGPELLRVTDRHGNEFCLGPTHEELITALVRNELRSYKDLPVSLYQTQIKFRDEIRPRFGLMRSREFVMKDAYSFHATQESLQETYDEMSGAYARMCDRMGLKWRAVEADSGQIGGKVTTEFMALADAGEAEIVHCESCGYAADAEAGACICEPTMCERDEMEKISTPGIHTIEELATFLGVPETSCVKALSGKDADGGIVVFFVPGDHELNDIKANRAVAGFELLTDEEMVEAGLFKGSMGPVGLPEGVRVIADENLKDIAQWAVGANEEGFHYVGARLGEDFQVDGWADLCQVKPGDACPECGKALSGARGIEVSQVFQLGTKYSESMGATFMDEDGIEKPFIMGCYGVGVTRSMAAIVEQYHDENGIAWPVSVAPAHVCVVPLTVGDEIVEPAARKIADELAEAGLEVAIDDRSERAGVKFADADLIGWPYQVVVGKRGLAGGTVELKTRATGEKVDVALDEVVGVLAPVLG